MWCTKPSKIADKWDIRVFCVEDNCYKEKILQGLQNTKDIKT